MVCYRISFPFLVCALIKWLAWFLCFELLIDFVLSLLWYENDPFSVCQPSSWDLSKAFYHTWNHRKQALLSEKDDAICHAATPKKSRQIKLLTAPSTLFVCFGKMLTIMTWQFFPWRDIVWINTLTIIMPVQRKLWCIRSDHWPSMWFTEIFL